MLTGRAGAWILAILVAGGAVAQAPPEAPLATEATAAPPTAEPEAAPAGALGVPVTLLSFAEPAVEVAGAEGAWQGLREGERLRTGQRLRTGPEGVARLEFPFMGLTVGPGSELWLPPGVVLSLYLERGRIEVASERSEIIKLVTPEAEVRGQGRVIVERREGLTQVLAFSGRVRVTGGGGRVALVSGEGTRVRPGKAPEAPLVLPPAPTQLTPGDDPPYYQVDAPVELTWSPAGQSHYVEVLSIDNDVVLLGREVGPPPFTVRLPWPGTFRWRVTTRGPDGLASLPSAEGLIPVMGK